VLLNIPDSDDGLAGLNNTFVDRIDTLIVEEAKERVLFEPCLPLLVPRL
jgi:hypothetical protein